MCEHCEVFERDIVVVWENRPVGWRCCNHQGRVAEPQHVEARDCAEPDCRARWNRESSQAESWKGGVPLNIVSYFFYCSVVYSKLVRLFCPAIIVIEPFEH